MESITIVGCFHPEEPKTGINEKLPDASIEFLHKPAQFQKIRVSGYPSIPYKIAIVIIRRKCLYCTMLVNVSYTFYNGSYYVHLHWPNVTTIKSIYYRLSNYSILQTV